MSLFMLWLQKHCLHCSYAHYAHTSMLQGKLTEEEAVVFLLGAYKKLAEEREKEITRLMLGAK